MSGRIMSVLAIAALAAGAAGSTSATARTMSGASHVNAMSPRAQSTGGGTLLLRGKLASSVSVSMNGALSVGKADRITWNLPLLDTVTMAGYQQTVQSQQFTFSVNPTSFTDTTESGQHVRQFVWMDPPANTVITVVQALKLTISTTLTPFADTSAFPLTDVPSNLAGLLPQSDVTAVPAGAVATARSLARGTTTEAALVQKINNWVASHTQYDPNAIDTTSARWVYANQRATCEGYANLMAGMLRTLGIPTQAEYGWVTGAPIQIKGKGNRTSSIQWIPDKGGSEFHAWLLVYFPQSGWVPFDPQLEKFFVDPRHISLTTAADAGGLMLGGISALYQDGNDPIGANLSNGQFEMVPGAGIGSKMAVNTLDSFKVTLGKQVSDVTKVILFGR